MSWPSARLAAIGVAVVPQVAQIVTANARSRPRISRRSRSWPARSVVFDAAGNQIDIFKAGEPRAVQAVARSPRTSSTPCWRSRTRASTAQGRQPEEPRAGHAGERLGRRGEPGRLHDHPAAGEEPPVDQRPRHRPQDPRGGLRRGGWSRSTRRTRSWSATSTPSTSGTTPTACRRRPRRTSARTSTSSTSGEGAFLAGLIRNPSGYDPFRHPERSQGPLQAGARPARGDRRQGDRGPGQPAANGPLPDAAAAGAQHRQAPLVLHRRGAQAAPVNETTILGDDQQERYNTLYRGRPEDLHHARPDPADGRRAGRGRRSSPTRAGGSQPPSGGRGHQDRARCGPWWAALASTSRR